MKKILSILLTWLSQLVIWKYRPMIIAITGNVGKTSTKETIATVLQSQKRVRSSGGNLNNEIGVPLTILGDWSEAYYKEGSSLFFWSRVIAHAFWEILYPVAYPEVLILEYGADRPGDIGRLASLFPPRVAVVTAVGEIPVHVEYFSDPDQVAREKSKLVRSVPSAGFAVLNQDDPAVLAMRDATHASSFTFGFDELATLRISHFDYVIGGDYRPEGVSFKLHYNGSFVPVKITGSLGKTQAYAAAAAAMVGVTLGMNLIEVSQALTQYQGVAGRMRILKGIKGSVLLDDTYNAAPASMHAALETLRDLPAQRRIAVLGDMLELGSHSIAAHQSIGSFAGDVADILVCVGEKAKFIAQAAADQMPADCIFTFHESREAKFRVQELIQEGDLILVKGSQGTRMEKIIEEVMAEPERKKELLVRQNKKWQDG